MKTNFKIVFKCILIAVFLYITPFVNGMKETLHNSNIMETMLYKNRVFAETGKIKEHLNIMTGTMKFTIQNDDFSFETTKENPISIPEIPSNEKVESKNKKIYIYNTHQQEGYDGNETVMDAAALLSDALQKKGFQVILETNDFTSYANANGMDYNQLYLVSNKFINDAFVNYGGFDLVIDLHRDSIPKEASYYEEQNKTYAKMMLVVGGLGTYASEVTNQSNTLTNIINEEHPGIMRYVMTREAYYNQQMNPNMVLIELGGDVNPFEEVKNSINILADGIEELLR